MSQLLGGSVAAVLSCFCFIIVAAVILSGLGALSLLFDKYFLINHLSEAKTTFIWNTDFKLKYISY